MECHPLSPVFTFADDDDPNAVSISRNNAASQSLLPLTLKTMDGCLALNLGDGARNHFLVVSIWPAMATFEFLSAATWATLVSSWGLAHG